jgi:DNA-binding NarL/FixJ family response regulator
MAAGDPLLRLLIAEDRGTLRDALNLFFSEQSAVEVVGAAASREQTLHLSEQLQPDVTLVDSQLGHVEIIPFITRLSVISPDTRIVIFALSIGEMPTEKILKMDISVTIAEGIFATDLLATILQVHRQP